jgi:hypothetical protein
MRLFSGSNSIFLFWGVILTKSGSENARRMKALGVDTNVIREVTGLTAEEIGAL